MPNNHTDHRQLAAIMFTDMVGYSAVAQKDEALALQLLEEHRRLLRPVFARHRGTEIKTMGDAFLVEFASALEAVRCAIELQRTLAEHNASAPDLAKLLIRVGIHLGDVIHQENDVLGDGVNIAARLEPLAEPGGICLSEDVARQVDGKVAAPLIELGRSELKHIQLPVKVYRVALPGQARRLALLEQLGFRFRQNVTQRWAAGLGLCLAALLFSLWPKTAKIDPGLAPRLLSLAPPAPLVLDRQKIVLLPLRSFNTSVDGRRFAEGLTEDLNTRLGAISSLRVMAQQSAKKYRELDLATIGREWGAAYVLSGGVQQEGNQLRISVQLIDVASEHQLWTTNYDEEAGHIFDVQKAVAQRVVDTLQVKLLHSERQVLEEKPTENIAAYNLYLQGLVDLDQISDLGADQAITAFKKATELDPQYAVAFVGLARAYIYKAKFSQPGGDLDQKAVAAVNTALALALARKQSLPEAYVAQGDLAYMPARRWDAASAVQAYRQALKLNPNLPAAHEGLAFIFSHSGLLPEAESQARAVLAVDPQNNLAKSYLGQALIYQGKYADAASVFEKFTTDFGAWGRGWLPGLSLFYLRQTNEAAAVLEKHLAMPEGTNHPAMTSVQAMLYAAAGQEAKAEERIQLTLSGDASRAHFHHAHYQIGVAYALMNKTDEALRYLLLAANDGFRCYPFFANDPGLRKLWTDPRGRKFLADQKQEWENLKASLAE